MKLNKSLFLERFVILAFPIALAVGCTKAENSAGVTGLGDKTVQDETHTSGKQPETRVDSVRAEKSTPAKATAPAAVKSIAPHTPPARVLPVSQTAQPPSKGIFYFAANKYDISETDKDILRRHAEFLLQSDHTILRVDGFADNRGSPKLNHQLSKKRAQRIAELLVSYGAPEARIKVNGYGESFPINNESNWDENRRVELEYLNLGGAGIYAGLR